MTIFSVCRREYVYAIIPERPSAFPRLGAKRWVTRLLAQTCCVDTSPLHSGGTVDDTMQFVYTWVFWLSVILGTIVAALLLYAYFRFRRRSDDDEPEQVHGNTRLEITWTIIPLAVFLSLFALTAFNMPFVNDTPASASMSVTVVGQQFSWTFDYGTNSGGKRVQELRHSVRTREHRRGPPGGLDGPPVQPAPHSQAGEHLRRRPL